MKVGLVGLTVLSGLGGGCNADGGGFGPGAGSGSSTGTPSVTTTVGSTTTGSTTTTGGSTTGSSSSSGEDDIKLDVSHTDIPQLPQCGCSGNLQAVVCDGVVVEECGGDTACANAECIDDPCAAAELAQSTVGCEFYAAKTAIIAQGDGACFVAFIANTWDTPIQLNVEWDGLVLPTQEFARIPSGQGPGLTYEPLPPEGLPPGEVAILFLARETQFGDEQPPSCPVTPALEIETGVVGTGRGHAFRIGTDRPVVAYQMLPYGGGSAAITSASLLFPTSAWDTNYVAINAYRKSIATPESQPSLLLVAEQNGTEVTINPVAHIVGGGEIAASPAEVPVTFVLDEGETLQLNQDVELTGSAVESSARIGIFGADSCMNVPPTSYACDSAHQQIPPVRALGSRYAAVRYPDRDGQKDETPPWRVVGIVDGTELSWHPAKPEGAPATLDQGEVAEFRSVGQFVVSSQDSEHPFYAASYMTGGNGFHGEGDAEWVNLVPVDQFLEDYVLYTDPSYSRTNLVVVRRPGPGGFEPVTLDCAGELDGWMPLGDYEYTRIDLVDGDFEPVGTCANGRQHMSSAAPFGVTVWGWGSNASTDYTRYVSYAYAAGASMRSINDVIVPAG